MSTIPREVIKLEEYKIWKKNSPYLYDTVGSYELEWPSLTVSWFPDKCQENDKMYSVQRLLLGTHTTKNEPNALIIGQIRLPKENLKLEEKFFCEETAEYGGFGQGGSVGKFEIIQKIPHPTEINRARSMPQNPDIIATKTASADVLIFDRTKHPSEPPADGKINPQMKLSGHIQEGYGIDWNLTTEGRIVSSGDDGFVCVWDISRPQAGFIEPLRIFKPVSSTLPVVEDVAWHYKNSFFFASASDDTKLRLWDVRQTIPTTEISGHRSEVNAVAFSPHSEFFLLSGSKDRTVGLWDLRNPSVRLHMLEGHEDPIYRVAWSPFSDAVVASCGSDGKVAIWDLDQVGKEQSPEDAIDGPPELLFVHGGHTDKVSDFAWNSNEDWTIASVADDNVLQTWTVAEAVYKESVDVKNLELE